MKLNENPFRVPTPDGDMATELSSDSYAFGFDKTERKAYIGNYQDHHDQIYQQYQGNTPMKRNSFRYPGRFWTDENVISFWIYPDRYQFFPLMKTLEEEWKERFPKKEPLNFSGEDWYVEVMEENDYLRGHLISFNKYENLKDPGNVPHSKSLTESLKFRKLIRSQIKNYIKRL